MTMRIDTDGKAYHFCSTDMNTNMNITPTNINTYSPNEILNNFANIFEKSRKMCIRDRELRDHKENKDTLEKVRIKYEKFKRLFDLKQARDAAQRCV